MNGFASTNAIVVSSLFLLNPVICDTNNEESYRINKPYFLNGPKQESSSTLNKTSVIQFVQNSRNLRLKELSRLKEGWDGYNALPISQTVIRRTSAILPEFPYNADVIPTSRGSIQIEFVHNKSNYFEVEIFSTRYSVYYEKDGQEKEMNVSKQEIIRILKEFRS